MNHRYQVLMELADANRPASVRNLYYRAVVAGLVTKTESGYQKVQRALVTLRDRGVLPFDWLTDSVRWRRHDPSWDTLEQALANTARTYRRSLWSGSPFTVEVWCESDSIAGTVWPVCDHWDVPLLPVRGFSSWTFAQAAAMELNQRGRVAHVFYVGDHDPYGLDIEDKLQEYLARWCRVPVKWTRLGVTWDQAVRLGLPGTRPKKAYGYPLAVEAEALPPDLLRRLVDHEIGSLVDPVELAAVRVAEESEREGLWRIANGDVRWDAA
jgi:hypothetical protein